LRAAIVQIQPTAEPVPAFEAVGCPPDGQIRVLEDVSDQIRVRAAPLQPQQQPPGRASIELFEGELVAAGNGPQQSGLVQKDQLVSFHIR
jgi:hypothetical protein